MERRKFYRNKIKVMIDFLDGSDIEIGYTRDISVGGMFLETDRLSESGKLVFLDFFLPGVKRKFKLKGRVVWQSKDGDAEQKIYPGVGIEFVDMNDLNMADLKIGLMNNRREEYEDK
ncbi:MAG: PilZ domain-containing protein [Deltaproteobacteria bacterium]|nr:PilZ domain-containing protein [Deltaproteobacteria bacterium]MCL5276323.1 PilZ domain-containing protein [Deltaproteobacteria bacterium]